MNTLRFIPSERGGRKALYMGFVYTKHRNLASGSSWHCVSRHENCKGRVKIDANEETIQKVKTHNHIPDFGRAKALQLLAEARKRCVDEPNVNPAVLTRDTYSSADSETLVALPKERSVKRALRQLRKQGNQALPPSLDEMENIPEKYRTINGER